MKYYRTPQQITALTREIPLFEHRAQISRFVPTKHRGLREIGTLASMRKGVVKLHHEGDSHEIKASDAVRYFLVTGGPLDDAASKGSEIRVFGRVERGELVEAVAIDMSNVPDPEKKAG
jgi:hypothetical protein